MSDDDATSTPNPNLNNPNPHSNPNQITRVMTRPPGSAHGQREWNNLRGHKVGRYVTPHIPAIDPSHPKGYSPTAKMNLARRRQLAAIDAENKQLLWRMQTLRPSYSLSAIEADYERR